MLLQSFCWLIIMKVEEEVVKRYHLSHMKYLLFCLLSIYQVLKHCGMYLIVSLLLLLLLRVLKRCAMYLPYKYQSQLLRKSLSRPTDAVGNFGWGPPGIRILTTFLLTVKERHRSWWRKWQLGSARPHGIILGVPLTAILSNSGRPSCGRPSRGHFSGALGGGSLRWTTGRSKCRSLRWTACCTWFT